MGLSKICILIFISANLTGIIAPPVEEIDEDYPDGRPPPGYLKQFGMWGPDTPANDMPKTKNNPTDWFMVESNMLPAEYTMDLQCTSNSQVPKIGVQYYNYGSRLEFTYHPTQTCVTPAPKQLVIAIIRLKVQSGYNASQGRHVHTYRYFAPNGKEIGESEAIRLWNSIIVADYVYPPSPENAGVDQELMKRRMYGSLSYWRPNVANVLEQFPQFKEQTEVNGAKRLLTRAEYLKESLERAIHKSNADSTDLIEILTTSSIYELHTLVGNSDFCSRMAKHEELNKKGVFSCLNCFGQQAARYMFIMKKLCAGIRDESAVVGDVDLHAQILHEYFYDKKDVALANSIDILTTQNFNHLRAVFTKLEGETKRDFLKDITKEKGTGYKVSHFFQVVEAIVMQTMLGRPKFFAELLRSKIAKTFNKIGNDDKDALYDIRRIFLTRSQIDLAEIVAELEKQPIVYQNSVIRGDIKNVLNTIELNTNDQTGDMDAYKQLVDIARKEAKLMAGTSSAHQAPPAPLLLTD